MQFCRMGLVIHLLLLFGDLEPGIADFLDAFPEAAERTRNPAAERFGTRVNALVVIARCANRIDGRDAFQVKRITGHLRSSCPELILPLEILAADCTRSRK